MEVTTLAPCRSKRNFWDLLLNNSHGSCPRLISSSGDVQPLPAELSSWTPRLQPTEASSLGGQRPLPHQRPRLGSVALESIQLPVETQTVPGGMLLPQARQSNRMRSVASIEVEQQRTHKMIKARLRREFMNLLSFFSITSALLFRQARPLAGFTIVGLQV